MDTKELLKKYWFVALIAIVLLVFVGVYAVDSYNNREIRVRNRQENGKYVAYTIDGDPVYADDLYETLYGANGLSQTIVAYERALFTKAYETTEEMENNAVNSAASILSRYSQEYVLQSLQAMGYTNGIDDLKQYYIDAQKQELCVKDYVTANPDTYLTDTIGTNGRLIYHILVKCETTEVLDEEGNVIAYEANPTDEQKEKLTQIQDALKDENNTFEYVAYTYSDDGSAQNGGYIGLINEENRDNYYKVFSDASLLLKEGEVSEPIVSQAGYHIIKNMAMSTDKLLEDYYFLSDLTSKYADLSIRAVLAKGEELGFEIVDEELNAQLEKQLKQQEAE